MSWRNSAHGGVASPVSVVTGMAVYAIPEPCRTFERFRRLSLGRVEPCDSLGDSAATRFESGGGQHWEAGSTLYIVALHFPSFLRRSRRGSAPCSRILGRSDTSRVGTPAMRDVARQRRCRLPPKSGSLPVRAFADSGAEIVALRVGALAASRNRQFVWRSLVS